MLSQVEAVLSDDTLAMQRNEVCILWGALREVYPTEAAAIAAVKKNSAVALPYLNRPMNIVGSWQVLKEFMSQEEALQARSYREGRAWLSGVAPEANLPRRWPPPHR